MGGSFFTMSEIDYVVKNLKLAEKDTQVDFKKFYAFLRKLFSDHGYYVIEKEYIQKLKEDLKNKSIKLDPFKQVDDYSMFVISVRIKLSDAAEAKDEKGMFYQ